MFIRFPPSVTTSTSWSPTPRKMKRKKEWERWLEEVKSACIIDLTTNHRLWFVLLKSVTPRSVSSSSFSHCLFVVWRRELLIDLGLGTKKEDGGGMDVGLLVWRTKEEMDKLFNKTENREKLWFSWFGLGNFLLSFLPFLILFVIRCFLFLFVLSLLKNDFPIKKKTHSLFYFWFCILFFLFIFEFCWRITCIWKKYMYFVYIYV